MRTCSVSKEESWACSWNIFKAQNNGSYCGNKIVEEGEECDCGRPDECDAVDACCVARDDALRIPGCTVRQGKQCRWDTRQATFCASFICHSGDHSLAYHTFKTDVLIFRLKWLKHPGIAQDVKWRSPLGRRGVANHRQQVTLILHSAWFVSRY